MQIKGNTILISGGATGIGLALAEAFVQTGNEVIICGRRAQRLQAARVKLPRIHIRECDITRESDREALFNWTTSNFKNLNVLINNAGIQRRINLLNGIGGLLDGEDEIQTNLTAPVYLSARFIPFLQQKDTAAIINVSSALGFVPVSPMPVYCATKAALHSFTLSLRHQLRNTPVKVFEIVPPAVDTELGIPAHEKDQRTHGGIPPSEVSRQTLASMEQDEYEILVGGKNNLAVSARTNFDETYNLMNPR
ncbi:MAG: SDR family NAD(P)-dependent oxidoreductase [Dehalococcoidales bacterium]|nr:SDR family NAD(P)-dependent oxidoreductase [Dehalococcoidales bacterium]